MRLLAGKQDAAVKDLEWAGAQKAPSAAVFSDLSAAYLARWRSRGNPADLIRALEAADRAVSLDPNLAEAQFNLALTCEQLSLARDALASWQRVTELEQMSGWSEEARKHIAALRRKPVWAGHSIELDTAVDRQEVFRQIVLAFPGESRRYGEEVLLKRWALDHLAGDSAGANRVLAELQTLGRILAYSYGDWMLADSVEAIRRSAKPAIEALAEGHRLFGEGVDRYALRDGPAEARVFSEAGRMLRRSRSPFSRWADSYLGASYFFYPDYRRALRVLEPFLTRATQLRRYPSLLARIFWQVGLIRGILGDIAASQRAYLRSLRLFERVRDEEDAAVLHFLISEDLEDLGQGPEAWRHRILALTMTGEWTNQRWRHNVLYDASDACLRENKASAALYFQNEMVRGAAHDPYDLAEALLVRSKTYYKLGRGADPLRDLNGARTQTAKIESEGLRERKQADIALAAAEMNAFSNRRQELDTLTRAVAYYRNSEFSPLLVQALLDRSQKYGNIGDLNRSLSDLQSALSDIDHQRLALPTAELRASFLDHAHQAYDAMIRLQLLHHDEASAFIYSERGRAQALLEELVGPRESARQQPASETDVTRALPEGVVIVEYATLTDRLGIWVMRRGASPRSVTILLSNGALTAQVNELSSASDSGSSARLKAARAGLYDSLIRPIARSIAESAGVVFVPDKSLGLVPFSALYDRDKAKYLVEEKVVASCPSSSLYLRLLERSRGRPRPMKMSALGVGNPAHEEELFPTLPRLRNAEAEVAGLKEASGSAEVLVGSQATKSAFLASLPRFDVIHFAGHALINEEQPSASMLLLAAEPGKHQSGVLYAHDLQRLSLRRVGLVVLAGCNTASGRVGASEGVSSLARVFLSAGVPMVIGSLWSIEDGAAGSLLACLHRGIGTGLRPAAALRAAQLRFMKEHSDDPSALRTWSAFVAIGAL